MRWPVHNQYKWIERLREATRFKSLLRKSAEFTSFKTQALTCLRNQVRMKQNRRREAACCEEKLRNDLLIATMQSRTVIAFIVLTVLAVFAVTCCTPQCGFVLVF